MVLEAAGTKMHPPELAEAVNVQACTLLLKTQVESAFVQDYLEVVPLTVQLVAVALIGAVHVDIVT